MTRPLSHKLTQQVLHQLQVIPGKPTLRLLEQLVNAYVRTVPWESVFRIAKRVSTTETAACPRWPDEFWHDNLEKGGGGTCFESNYAFFILLLALGFEGYLTVNNMGERCGCHTAGVILLDGAKWLTDVGFPVLAPLPISPKGTMIRNTKFLHYAVRPDGGNVYQIEQWPHPRYNCFTLIDEPVADDDYRAAITADYGENGHFLDSIIINKIIDERPWRFYSGERPWCLNTFWEGVRQDKEMAGDVITAVAQHFSLDEPTLHAAWQALGL
jgi:arylamine N-acetyltransferase